MKVFVLEGKLEPMKKKLELETWVRKEHFNLFNKFDEPYFGVTVNFDYTIAYRFAKQNGISLFLYQLYLSLRAAHAVESFKYRIENEEVFVYDQINAGSTIGRSNGTFGFIHLHYYPTFAEFIIQATKEVERVQSRTDLERPTGDNLIRYSSLPWIDFTSLFHARNFASKDSCPRITFGKMTESNGRRTIPISIHVHHALVDGLQVGRYIDCFQSLLSSVIGA